MALPQFVCECGEKQGSKEALKSHICIKHLRYMPLECCHCSAQHLSTWEATKQDVLLHISQKHPGKAIKYTCFLDPQKQQLLKHKMQQSIILAMEQKNQTVISIPPTSAEVASKRTKPEVITIGDEGDYKPPSTPVVHHLSSDAHAVGTKSTNDVTHSTHQSQQSLGEATGSMDNHPGGNSMLSRGAKTPGVEDDTKHLCEAPQPVDDPVEECKVESDDEDDGDDFEPETPPAPIKTQQPEVGRQSHQNPSITNAQQERRAKLEAMADGDDVYDDFVPFPPSANTRSKDVGRCSAAVSKDAGDGSSQRLPTPDGSKRAKLKVKGKEGRKLVKRSKNHRYCLTCEREYPNICQHLKLKLSTPVFECSRCLYKAKDRNRILVHIRARVCGRGAKIVRIRSKIDVVGEMRQLRETHLGVVPRALPYRCKECKVDIADSAVSYHILKHHLKLNAYACPVCGWSGPRSTVIQKHMGNKHRWCTIRPIFNQAKYKTQIDARKLLLMEKAVSVRN